MKTTRTFRSDMDRSNADGRQGGGCTKGKRNPVYLLTQIGAINICLDSGSHLFMSDTKTNAIAIHYYASQCH